MAGMPRLGGLLKKGAATPSLRNFSFTVAGQDAAKVKVGEHFKSAIACTRFMSSISYPFNEDKRKTSLPTKEGWESINYPKKRF